MGLTDYVGACLLYCLFLQLIAFHRSFEVNEQPEIKNSSLGVERKGWPVYESKLPARTGEIVSLKEVDDDSFIPPHQPNRSSLYWWEERKNKPASPKAILSSTLALSLLLHSTPSSESFVFSPFSLNTALSIVHDGASGKTQKELTNLLLKRCSPSEVTDFYSSLAHSISSTSNAGVSFESANRFYVDDSISLKEEYQKHTEDKYNVEVKNLDFSSKVHAANTMNEFIEGATNGKIKDMIDAASIKSDTAAVLINAVHFLGNWKNPFDPKLTHQRTFYGVSGERRMDFMHHVHHSWDDSKFRVNQIRNFATAVLVPYQVERYNFFYLLPFECTPKGLEDGDCESSSNWAQLRRQLTGKKLVTFLKNAIPGKSDIIVPKLKIESELDGKEVLSKLGVNDLFTGLADFSKVSSTPLYVSEIKHKAMIEMDEKGVEAAAATVVRWIPCSYSVPPPPIVIDRPFLFGIIRDDDILFLGQYV